MASVPVIQKLQLSGSEYFHVSVMMNQLNSEALLQHINKSHVSIVTDLAG